MGGKLLADMGAVRVDRQRYLELETEILGKLILAAPGLWWTTIRSYKTKATFGDMDILCTRPEEVTMGEFHKQIADILQVGDKWKANGDTASYLYNNLQVDIIPMPDEDFDTAFDYYAYNDLGNLVGKIYHSLGLKYGHRGLHLVVMDGTQKVGEIEISKDTEDIYSFLGLDYGRYISGFDTLEEIFEFVESSPFFSPDIFWYENLNSENRRRDKLRSTYATFVDRNSEKPSARVLVKDTRAYLPFVFSHFGTHVRVEYEALWSEYRAQLEFHSRFNGKVVGELTGLVGPELGEFMKLAKTRITITMSQEEINEQIRLLKGPR